jgi:hypothetical protein
MKIIITESQLKMLMLIKESEDKTNTYIAKLNDIAKILNNIYSKVSFITIAEMLNRETDIKPIYDMVNNLEKQNSNLKHEINVFFNSFDEDTYFAKWEKISEGIDELYYKNVAKITVLTTIVNSLDNIVYDSEDYKDAFSDIESINIG